MFSSCWPSSQSCKGLKVFIITNTPITVQAHIPWMFIFVFPLFLEAEIVTCFPFKYFAVTLVMYSHKEALSIAIFYSKKIFNLTVSKENA